MKQFDRLLRMLRHFQFPLAERTFLQMPRHKYIYLQQKKIVKIVWSKESWHSKIEHLIAKLDIGILFQRSFRIARGGRRKLLTESTYKIFRWKDDGDENGSSLFPPPNKIWEWHAFYPSLEQRKDWKISTYI